MRVNQRPSGVAAVDGGVGLNRFINKRGLAGLHCAAQRAHHTRSERRLEAERIADGQNLLPHLQRRRIAQRQRAKLLAFGLDLHQRNVIALVRADELRRIMALIAQDHFNRLRPRNHVIVRQDIAARINNKSRACAFHRHGIHEEIVLRGLRQNIGHSRRCLAVDAHVDGFFLGQRFILAGHRLLAQARLHGGDASRFHLFRLLRAVARPYPKGSQHQDQGHQNQASSVVLRSCVICVMPPPSRQFQSFSPLV